MRKDVKKADGWRMVYCLFDARLNYYGLYNIYTGVLRNFYYQGTNTSAAGELAFIITPNAKNTLKYPYYHNWQYGIPANHTDVHTKKSPYDISSDAGNTFQNLITPYPIDKLCMLGLGWFAFDMDMSFYAPNVSHYTEGDGLAFLGHTQQNSSVSLSGTIAGTITDPPVSAQIIGTVGIFGDILSDLGSVGSGMASVFTECAKNPPNYYGAIAGAIGNAFVSCPTSHLNPAPQPR
ncbi:MAG: hypothetical protein LBP98_10215 [Tannerella sp.]|jgi:hypothetical protein|nr:hypothetical protein [Tannerella sp.]